MPFLDDPRMALTWNIEAPYLALSENKLESSVLSEEQFEHCLGSSKYRICSEALGRRKDTLLALQHCNFLVLLTL